MLTRIAFVAPQGHSQKKLRSLLSRPLAYVVREFHNMEEVHRGLSQFVFQVLVIRVPTFGPEHVQMVQKLRWAYPTAGLILISPQIDPRARYQLKGISRQTLLDEELEIDDLHMVIKRSTEAKHLAAPRMHPRTRREGHAVLIVKNEDDSEVQIQARFLDFARMGARLVMEIDGAANFDLRPKTRIELRYRSSENGDRVHRIESRLVWSEEASNQLNALFKKTKAEIGLRFVAEL